MRWSVFLVISGLLASPAFAHSDYTGYSGAPGQRACASSCHGSGGGTITVNGFPTTYTPNQQYLIAVTHGSGGTIVNFNSSCRVGTGTANAGAIAAGTGTSTYNVSGETNGVHFTSGYLDAGDFQWTAPAAGTGEVRLYLAGLQGMLGGPNSTLVLIANEEVSGPPGAATHPSPADGATGVSLTPTLTWTAGAGATSHDVYFGTSDPPAFVGNQAGASYAPPGPLAPLTVYYWRIDERNGSGVTTGTVWQFTTTGGGTDGKATDPTPPNGAVNVSLRPALSWHTTADHAHFDVYLGTDPAPPRVSHGQSRTTYRPRHRLKANTHYYWRIDVITQGGTIVGDIWDFTTKGGGVNVDDQAGDEHDGDGDHTRDDVETSWQIAPTVPAIGAPLGTRNTITIPFELAEASSVNLAVFDVMGREVAVLASGSYAAGEHTVAWSSAGCRSGVYILRLEAAGGTVTRKVMVLK